MSDIRDPKEWPFVSIPDPFDPLLRPDAFRGQDQQPAMSETHTRYPLVEYAKIRARFLLNRLPSDFQLRSYSIPFRELFVFEVSEDVAESFRLYGMPLKEETTMYGVKVRTGCFGEGEYHKIRLVFMGEVQKPNA